jgi:hypothetical protein
VPVLVGVVLLVGSVAGCDRGPFSAGSAGAGVTSSASAGLVDGPECPVGRWSISAQEEFVQVGLGTLTDGSVRATGGTVRVVFAPDHTYTFTYDKVLLSLGGGAGTASVNGPVHGTWQLAGDTLTTTVRSSTIAVRVSVAGVTVTPSGSLDKVLQKGMPGSARVECSAEQLVTTITTGAASGRQVAFARS